MPAWLISGEVSRIASRLADNLLIGHDDGGAGLHRIGDLVRKLRAETQASRDIVGLHRAAAVRDAHPSAGFASRCQAAHFSAAAFEQGEHVTAQAATARYFYGRPPDRLTIAIDINGTVSRADYHRHWSFSAALGIPVII